MTRDQNKFNSLKNRKSGNVSFGNEKLKPKNVFLVKDLKHNLFSIGKLCDQGYNLIFNSQTCEIIESYSG